MIQNYRIGTTVYPSFYKALEAARIMGNGTQIQDMFNNVVFYNDGHSTTRYLYNDNGAFCGTASSLSYSQNDLIQGASLNTDGKMRTWLSNNPYSKAVRGDAKLSNSRVRVFYKKAGDAVTLNGIYNKQEVNSGSYYTVRSLSSGYDNQIGKRAKITVSLSNTITNLTSETNGYIFVGIVSGTHFFECGLQLCLLDGIYKWCIFKNNSIDGFERYTDSPIAMMNAGGDVVVEVVKVGSTAVGYIWYNNSLVKTITMSYDAQFADSVAHEFYRTISFCPYNSNSSNIVPNLNNGEYFAGLAFKNAYLAYGSIPSYVTWPYYATFNQYAVAFNDEFIDVTPSTEHVNISYKGRNSNNVLVLQ